MPQSCEKRREPFDNGEPRLDECLFGFVNILNRREDEEEGKIRLKTEIDGNPQSVNAVLSQSEYARAIKAHADKAPVVAEGRPLNGPASAGFC